jgi:hypothetical protein
LRERLVKAHPEIPSYRTGLGETFLRLGQVESDLGNQSESAIAWKRACMLFDEGESLSGELTFPRACCHAGLAGLAGRSGAGVSAAEAADQAEVAMASLRRSVALGYRNAGAYRTEKALDSVRERADFKKLVQELEKPSAAEKK